MSASVENTKGSVILVDDEEHIRIAGRQSLELAGYDVTCFATPYDALAHLSRSWPGVVVSDIKMPRMDGLAFMREVRNIDPKIPVILITGHGDIAMAVEAIRGGAYDFIEKPFSADRLVEVTDRGTEVRQLVLENRSLRDELSARSSNAPAIVGRSTPIEHLRAAIANVADTNADILVLGETGTGKELVARNLHDYGPRRNGNFVAINCGAMPESIFESELFGHEAGAFTDAKDRRIGKLEHASGGTLFLDEIESMPQVLQVKFLRVLQERVIERIGSNELHPVDLRVIAATKVDLKEASDRGEFRHDLLYRLNVVTIAIPPLRDRRDDIALLFGHFVDAARHHYKREAPQLDAQLMGRLMGHDWPGNVRELKNVADRFVLTGSADLISPGYGNEVTTAQPNAPQPLTEQMRHFEKGLIIAQLKQHNGDVKAVTDALGLPRKTFYDKLKKHGLERSDFE